jgi:flagellar protein FliS
MSSYARRKVASYRHVQNATTTPAQRVVLCYNAVARDLEKALRAFDDTSPDRLVDIHNALNHARLILNELRLALDKNAQPALAESLDDLYGFWINAMSDANAKKDPAPLRDIVDMVREMRDAWQQAAATVAAEKR